MPLNPKQERFVAEYIANPNASEAARRAGYSDKTAYSIGQRLLKNVEIATAIDAGLQQIKGRIQLTVERTLEEIGRVAYADPRKLFDEAGNLLPIHQLDDITAATIASVEVSTERDGDGESRAVTTTTKIKSWDKMRALDMAGRYHGLFKDRIEHTGKDGGPMQVDNLTLARWIHLKLKSGVAEAERPKLGSKHDAD
jgi:phage terminase small subunit